MQLESIIDDLKSTQQQLFQHRVFSQLTSRDDLQSFMQWHVFAVWDFMSLTKRLQHELTSMTVPWMPPRYPVAARLINEIVLAEESDETPTGDHLSHYELYLQAMREIGADTDQVELFVDQLRAGKSLEQALRGAKVPSAVAHFVTSTINATQRGSLIDVLGYFFFGREDIIPDMFQSLLDRWQIDQQQAPVFVYYLQRHIELDGDQHGPAALQIIREITEQSPHALEKLKQAAEEAIAARQALWDGLAQELDRQNQRLDQAV